MKYTMKYTMYDIMKVKKAALVRLTMELTNPEVKASVSQAAPEKHA